MDPIKLAGFKGKTSVNKDDYYVYVGRLSPEKGVKTLLAAAANTPYRLKIAGGGPLLDELQQQYSKNTNIEFLGHLSPEGVGDLMQRAKAIVQPSECYENNPLSVIEALCAGIPVIGANIGGIPELITPETGKVYPSGDVSALMECIKEVMSSDRYDYRTIAEASQERFSFESHFEELKELYS